MATANDVMRVAESFLGVKESPPNSNNVVFNSDYYGHAVSGASYPWCMAFLWDVFRIAGASDLCVKTAYCPTYEEWAKSRGWAVSKSDGKYGDVATMDFGKGRASHIGFIVSKQSDGTYQTIEGNTSTASDDNGGAVMRRIRTQANIRQIFRPAYGGEMSKITFDTNRFLAQCDTESNRIRADGHFVYGDSGTLPPGADHKIACDRFPAMVLYDLGMTDQPRGGFVTGNMDAWLTSHGFERNKNAAAVRAGDIVLMGKNGVSVPDPSFHAFVVTKVYPGTGRVDKYDYGAQWRIPTVQPFRNVVFNEWNYRYFYASYRIPNTNGYLPQDTMEFDWEFYGGRWPDVLKAFGWNSAKLLSHWSVNGKKEGRRGNVLFDPQFYANKYKDLWKAFGSNWSAYFDHFMKYGMREGRTPSAMFDLSFYKKKYADLRKAFGNDNVRYYNHFISHGMKEGRQGSAAFNPKAYRKRYTDLAKAYGNNWPAYYRHYVIHGEKEGRKGA